MVAIRVLNCPDGGCQSVWHERGDDQGSFLMHAGVHVMQ